MGKGIIERLLSSLREVSAKLTDKREASNGQKYHISDFAQSAFAVFYYQHPSLLNFQEKMEAKRGRSNLQTLFGIAKIPKADQIRNVLDEIAPKELYEAFDEAHKIAQAENLYENYRVLNGTIPVALDGVHYFSSEQIHCEHCLTKEHKKKDKETGEETSYIQYYHTMLASCMVKPGGKVVLPLIPEFIRNEDGKEKQDCERNAAKRWIASHKERYSPLNVTLLGDDLFCCHSICSAVVDAKMHFLFTCKEDSHPWIYEQVTYGDVKSYEKRTWNGRNHLIHRYRFVNGIENRAEGEKILVNYLYYEIYNEEKKTITYRNSWITSHELNAENVETVADCGRARWKIENEHNNVLKNHGYNLEHNFGHGKHHACEIFCLLNLLAFLFHGIQDSIDEDYIKARSSFGRKDDFFAGLRYEVNRYLHDSWLLLFLVLSGDEPDS
jgi:hypothetical protein